MIERNDFMSDKKYTIEELTKLREDAKKAFDDLDEQWQKQQKEEEERRVAELYLQKEARQKELEDAFKNYRKLLNEFIQDYGSASIITSSDDWFPIRWWC